MKKEPSSLPPAQHYRKAKAADLPQTMCSIHPGKQRRKGRNNQVRAAIAGLYIALGVLTAPVHAQNLMGLSRYDDNFKALATDTGRTFTLLPFIKALPFDSSSNYYIGFGGEIRGQYQVFNNESWGALPPGATGSNNGKPFLLQRYLLHANLQLSKYLRLFGELKSALESGRATGPRPVIDVDHLDLHQAFADLRLFPSNNTALTLRVGRQELNYGAHRLISSGEGLNTKQTFQGIKLLTEIKGVKTDAFYTYQVGSTPGVFDNKVNRSTKLYGVYSRFNNPVLTNGKAELYAIGYQNGNSRYIRNSGKEKRYSFGFRMYGTLQQAFSYELEATYQAGKVETARIAAYMAVGRFIYTFREAASKPAIGLVAQIASGDRLGSTALNNYHPLYARDYYGLGVPYWSSNLMQLAPTFQIKPLKKLVLDCAVHSLWRQSTADGLYLAGMMTRSPFVSGTQVLSGKRFVGLQYDFNPVFAVTNYFSLGTDVTLVPVTDYVRETGAANALFFCSFQASFRF